MKLKWILTAWCLVFLLLAAPSHILAASLREPPATEQLGEVPAESRAFPRWRRALWSRELFGILAVISP